MSEYQYYEFRAVDQPLMREQMGDLRKLSTRADITPTSFTNTYSFGDFRGNPRKLMESYFDAHVYVSNFGTVTLLLRLQKGVVPEGILTQYFTGEGLEWWIAHEHVILQWELNTDDPPDEWVEGKDWMAQLLPIRDELVRGDYRSLYVGWLSSITGETPGDEETEPPVLPGLGALTGAQTALGQFLNIDIDLITAAAETSPKIAKKGPPAQDVDSWVSQLPEQEMRSIVARLIHGEGLRVQTELQSRYYRSGKETTSNSESGSRKQRRTASDLLALAEKTTHERKRRESEEKQKKRHAYLNGFVPRFTELWATLGTMAEDRTASSYDKVRVLLVDMRDAYAQAGLRPDFDAELTRFLGRYSGRAALVRRLKEARLIP